MREGKEKIGGSMDGKEWREGVGKEGKESKVVVGWKERKSKEGRKGEREGWRRKGKE
jgi:hypothetical protein